MKFACVDGPEFDAHQVDFDELMRRNRTYVDMERLADEGLAGPRGESREGKGVCQPAEAAR